MVNGLKLFQEAFETYADQYILRQDMATFLSSMEAEEVDLKALGIRIAAKADILAGLRIIYCS